MKKCATAAACAVIAAGTTAAKETSVSFAQPFRNEFAEIRGGATSNTDDSSKTSSSTVPRQSRKRKSSKKNNKSGGADQKNEAKTTESSDKADAKGKTANAKDVNSTKDAKSTKEDAKKTPELNPIARDILEQTDYYKILGVSRSATIAEIKKAYRRRAVQTHPDKLQGDRRAFDKIAKAHDILSDDEKREYYNRFGEEGLDQAGGGRFPFGARGSSFQEEILRSFFGGSAPGGFRGQQQRPAPRNRTVRYQLEVTLEDLYKGMTRSVLIASGSTTRSSPKSVEVHVQRGMASGESIVLSGEMDQVADATPADVVFLLVQRQHPVFTRKGHDLAVELTISLREALCGFTRTINHLDGRRVTFRPPPEKPGSEGAAIIQTGEVHVLKGEGMPKRGLVGQFGDLYVQYKVEMPKASKKGGCELNSDEREQLGQLLDKLEGCQHSDSSDIKGEARYLQTAAPSDFGHASGKFEPQKEEHHEEEEGQEGFNPFGRHFHHFHSSGPSHFFSQQHSFGDGNSDVQCQQM